MESNGSYKDIYDSSVTSFSSPLYRQPPFDFNGRSSQEQECDTSNKSINHPGCAQTDATTTSLITTTLPQEIPVCVQVDLHSTEKNLYDLPSHVLQSPGQHAGRQWKKAYIERNKSEVAKFACSLCVRTFPSQWKLTVHLRSHTNERPFPCGTCSFRCKTKFALDNHMKTHVDVRTFTCPHSNCGKMFKFSGDLRRHSVTHEADFSLYKCSLCDKQYRANHSLLVHVRKVHMDLLKYECDVCSKKFVTSSKLKQHMRIHTGFKPHACTFPYCDRTFADRSSLKKHLDTHEPSTVRKYQCILCPKAYRSSSSLSVHRHLMHSDKHRQDANNDFNEHQLNADSDRPEHLPNITSDVVLSDELCSSNIYDQHDHRKLINTDTDELRKACYPQKHRQTVNSDQHRQQNLDCNERTERLQQDGINSTHNSGRMEDESSANIGSLYLAPEANSFATNSHHSNFLSNEVLSEVTSPLAGSFPLTETTTRLSPSRTLTSMQYSDSPPPQWTVDLSTSRGDLRLTGSILTVSELQSSS